MNTLVINSHPEYDVKDTYSHAIYEHFLTNYHENYGSSNLEKIDLYNMNIPQLDKDMLSVFTKMAKQESLTDVETNIQINMKSILEQFKNSKRVIIIMPLFNFNVPSRLKDYIDNILIPRETFRYTESGSMPLLTDGRKIILIQTSGSVFTNNDRYKTADHAYQYLKTVFCEFMGFDSFEIIRVQGTGVKDANRELILQQAFVDIDKSMKEFYGQENN